MPAVSVADESDLVQMAVDRSVNQGHEGIASLETEDVIGLAPAPSLNEVELVGPENLERRLTKGQDRFLAQRSEDAPLT